MCDLPKYVIGTCHSVTLSACHHIVSLLWTSKFSRNTRRVPVQRTAVDSDSVVMDSVPVNGRDIAWSSRAPQQFRPLATIYRLTNLPVVPFSDQRDNNARTTHLLRGIACGEFPVFRKKKNTKGQTKDNRTWVADQEPVKLKRLEPWNHLTSVRSVWPKTLLRRSRRYRFQNIASGEAWRFPF